MDISNAQIGNATSEATNISFRQGYGEDLSFMADGTVDLITIALGLHWLDQQKFFKEARRVVANCGIVVAYGYKLFSLDNTEANTIIEKV